MRRGGRFADQVRDPVTELVVTRRDKAAPAYSQGHGRLRTWCCSRCINEGGLGALFHIAGRGHLAIPAHPVTSRLPWMATTSVMPPSFLPIAVDVPLGPFPFLGSPPGPSLQAGKSSSAPLSFPPGGRLSGPPSITHHGPWALQ